MDDRLSRSSDRRTFGQDEGPLLRLSMPHHHELHQDLSQGKSWLGCSLVSLQGAT
jgi:hypothetical protein